MGLINREDPAPKDPPPEPVPILEMSDKQLELLRHRYREARKASMCFTDAKLFAGSHVDIEDMRALARTGCPPHLLLRILL